MKYQNLDGRNEISVMFWKFVCSSCTNPNPNPTCILLNSTR